MRHAGEPRVCQRLFARACSGVVSHARAIGASRAGGYTRDQPCAGLMHSKRARCALHRRLRRRAYPRQRFTAWSARPSLHRVCLLIPSEGQRLALEKVQGGEQRPISGGNQASSSKRRRRRLRCPKSHSLLSRSPIAAAAGAIRSLRTMPRNLLPRRKTSHMICRCCSKSTLRLLTAI